MENDVERQRRQEAWLNDMLRIAGRGGHSVRVLFDQLVVDINPDCGPLRLDPPIGAGGQWRGLEPAFYRLESASGMRRCAAACNESS